MLHENEKAERRDMARWSFPIVCDLVRERYTTAVDSLRVSVFSVSFAHGQLWQALILDQPAAILAAREELSRNLQNLGLPLHVVVDIDEQILDELMDVAIQRFHRTPFKATICGHILLHIAKNLTYTPEVLAAA